MTVGAVQCRASISTTDPEQAVQVKRFECGKNDKVQRFCSLGLRTGGGDVEVPDQNRGFVHFQGLVDAA
jgi:hypothetical protein